MKPSLLSWDSLFCLVVLVVVLGGGGENIRVNGPMLFLAQRLSQFKAS